MTKLWILLAVSLMLAWLINNRDIALDRRGFHRKERSLTCLLILILCFFCGLRTWGNDTGTYIEIYEYLVPTFDTLKPSDVPAFSSGIGLFYLNVLMKTLNFSTQDFLMFYAFLTVIPYVLFVRKHSESFVFGVFLMFTTGFYTFTLAAIKQCMATGLCLLAIDQALNKKWTKFSLLVLLGMTFHPYAMVYFLVPFLMFKPWTKRTWLYIVIFILAGFSLEALLGTILDITDMMGASYDVTSFVGEGVNLFRVLVSFVPLIIAAVYGKALFQNSTKKDDLMFNMAMLNALIMFVGLFGTANYFARLANYFLPGQVVTLPWLLRRIHPNDKKWMIPACIVGYLGYFIYENAIIRPFDTGYSHTSFWGYLASLF